MVSTSGTLPSNWLVQQQVVQFMSCGNQTYGITVKEQQAMAETHPIRLRPAEILHQAQRFFGPEGLGMELETSEPDHARFASREGFVEFEIRQAGNFQVRLTIEHQGYEQEIQAFRRQLAKQARAETKASG